MGIQRCSHGFRARVKKDGRTFNGPIRETEADAEEDEIQYKQAAAESLEKLQEVHETLPVTFCAIQKHKNSWRARIIKDGKVYYGNTKCQISLDCSRIFLFRSTHFTFTFMTCVSRLLQERVFCCSTHFWMWHLYVVVRR